MTVFFFLSFLFPGSDFKRLMAMIESKVKDSGRWSDVQTVDNAVAMFEVGKAAIALPAKSQKGYTRRDAGMAWSTVYKVLSESRRRKKSANAGRGKRERDEESESEPEEEEGEEAVDDEEVAEDAPAVPEANAAQPPKKRRNRST